MPITHDLEECAECCAILELDGHAIGCSQGPVAALRSAVGRAQAFQADIDRILGTENVERRYRLTEAGLIALQYVLTQVDGAAEMMSCGECGRDYLCRCHGDCAAGDGRAILDRTAGRGGAS